jgi:type IV secretion system protein VirB8
MKKQNKAKYAINWYADKYQSALVWRNWMLLIVLLCLLSVLGMTAAAMFFVPLKTVKPFVIQINEKTGATEVVSSKSLRSYSANEELIKFFAMNYIRARESYIISGSLDGINSIAQYNANLVRIMSVSSVGSLHRREISPENPESPVNKYGNNIQRQLFLRSFRVESKDESSGSFTVRARMTVHETPALSGLPLQYNIEILLSGYFNVDSVNKLGENDRLINPLGFTVTSYRADRDS